MDRVRFAFNRFRKVPGEGWPAEPDVRAFHQSLPGYAPTPLIELPEVAQAAGVARVWLKDESKRFGLNAFKGLGASYAVYRFLQRRWQERFPEEPFSPRTFEDPSLVARLGTFTFATATDGNHGRAVAWTARRLSQRAVIYVPSNTVRARIDAIRSEQAEVVVVDGTYDETVRRAAADAERFGWQVISDTAYPGYMEIPRWIMEGYTTIFAEAREQLPERETVVLLQAGVGGLACAGALFYQRERARRPALVSVEPTDADCLLESALAPDGSIRVARGKQSSIMAGLNCGTPSLLAWPVIRDAFDFFLAIDDDYAREAMRHLAASGVVSGESGAAGVAGLLALAGETALDDARRRLLPHDAKVLVVSTEGDTDPVGYRQIVSA